MAEGEYPTDAAVSTVLRCGGTDTGQLTGAAKSTLAQRQNKAKHVDPFDGLRDGGLLELVEDLITYAYRDQVAQAAGLR